MSEQVKVAVIYYSATGTVHELAKSVAAGAEKAHAIASGTLADAREAMGVGPVRARV